METGMNAWDTAAKLCAEHFDGTADKDRTAWAMDAVNTMHRLCVDVGLRNAAREYVHAVNACNMAMVAMCANRDRERTLMLSKSLNEAANRADELGRNLLAMVG